jgi:hypothetical protein
MRKGRKGITHDENINSQYQNQMKLFLNRAKKKKLFFIS